MTTKLLTVNEVADALDLKPARVYSLSREGKLPFLVKIGERQYRYHEKLMQEWLLNGGNADNKNEVTDEHK
jgi:excisionase family DNA binding protein